MLSGLMFVVFAAVYQTKTAEVAETRASVNSQIKTKTQEIDQILSAAEESLAPLRQRKQEEEGKTAGLQAAHEELSSKKAALESSVASLNEAIERLSSAKDEAKRSRHDNRAEIATLQKKITLLEKQVQALTEAVESVSEKVGV